MYKIGITKMVCIDRKRYPLHRRSKRNTTIYILAI